MLPQRIIICSVFSSENFMNNYRLFLGSAFSKIAKRYVLCGMPGATLWIKLEESPPRATHLCFSDITDKCLWHSLLSVHRCGTPSSLRCEQMTVFQQLIFNQSPYTGCCCNMKPCVLVLASLKVYKQIPRGRNLCFRPRKIHMGVPCTRLIRDNPPQLPPSWFLVRVTLVGRTPSSNRKNKDSPK